MTLASQMGEPRARGLIALCVLSFFGLALVPLLRESPYADLTGQFTDHIHHVYGVWLFWKHGVQVFTTPFGLLSGEGFPFSVMLWTDAPWMYPLGALGLFAPLTLLAKLVTLTFHQLAVATILYLLFWSHLGFYLFARACGRCPPEQRLLLTSFGWLMMMRLAVEGFFDPLWLGTGAAVVGCASRGKYEHALWWFALTASLHYRAAVFAPAAAYALFHIVRSRSPRNWPFGVLSWTTLSCLATLACFRLMYPISQLHRAHHPSYKDMLPAPLFQLVVALTFVVIVLLLFRRAWVGAASAALVGVIALSDFRGYLAYWHHAPTMLAAPVAAGLGLLEPGAQLSRVWALLYGLALARLVWGCSPLDLLTVLADKIRW